MTIDIKRNGETTVIEPAQANVGSLIGNMINLKIAFEVG